MPLFGAVASVEPDEVDTDDLLLVVRFRERVLTEVDRSLLPDPLGGTTLPVETDEPTEPF